MLLAIDIGNTNTRFGLFLGEKLLRTVQILTKNISEKTLKNIDNVSSIFISSVVPTINQRIETIVKNNFGLHPEFISSKIDSGIKFLYKNEPGADRVANIGAAIDIISTPFCVIDFGSATTYDIVNKKKEYIGGLIVPGIKMGIKSLLSTSIISQRALRFNLNTISCSKIVQNTTEGCVKSGIYWGEIERVKGIMAKIEREIGEKINCIVTGGDGKRIAKELGYNYDPYLTLRGINSIATKFRTSIFHRAHKNQSF
jgi:type III pantothenate kinase